MVGVQPLVFTYYLGEELSFDAVTLTERPDEAMDVLTVYYSDRDMLDTPDCADAIEFYDVNEILCASPEHLDDLHRVDLPRNVHAHIKKPRKEILKILKVLFERHLDSPMAELHFARFTLAQRYLGNMPEIAGIWFDQQKSNFVHNQACVDLDEPCSICYEGFVTIGA